MKSKYKIKFENANKELNSDEFPRELYNNISTSEINEVISNKIAVSEHLEMILTEKILPLFKGRYLVKYKLLGDNKFTTPFYTFETTNSVENLIELVNKRMKRRSKFLSVRVDFIDPDSNLKIFIINILKE